MLLEVHALKKDKRRLTELLRSTKEFRDFTDFSDDSGGNLRYLPGGSLAKTRLNSARGKKTKLINAAQEKENWIPAEAFSLAFDVTNQTGGEISP